MSPATGIVLGDGVRKRPVLREMNQPRTGITGPERVARALGDAVPLARWWLLAPR